MSFFSRRKDKKSDQQKTAETSLKRNNSQRSTQSLRKVELVNGEISDEQGGSFEGRSHTGPIQLCVDEDYDPGDLGAVIKAPTSLVRHSKLSKTLEEILKDKDALSCFIEFMESRKAGQYIKFWLDAESFQASTWSRLRSHSLNSAKRLTLSGKHYRSPSDTSVSVKQVTEDKLDTESIGSNQTLTEETSSGMVESENQTNGVPTRISSDTGQSRSKLDLPGSELETVIKAKPSSLPVTPIDPGAKHLPGSSGPDCDIRDSMECRLSDAVSTSAIKRTESLKKTNYPLEELADKLKKSIARDAVSIFQKYLSHDASSPVEITDELRNRCMAKICREDGEVDPGCFADCQEFVLNVIRIDHFPDFSTSEFLCKHQVHLLTKGQITLSDILYNDGAMFYFMEYMEQEGGSELLQFWLAVDNFWQHLMSCEGTYDGMQAQSDAMVLYDKYFSLQASHPLGFDDKTRFVVEGNICREEGPLPDCFSKTQHIVYRTMEKSFFPSFLQSEIYYKYLSELVSTVTIATDLPKQTRHKRQDSDATSVHSGQSIGSESIKNTLLAMDTSHLRKSVSPLQESDMNVDPRLLNPELLWKRQSPGMSMGKVDELGRFMSELDPQPEIDKVKGNQGFFKKRKGKDKEQEDMALQIAQKIISDVTSVTQAIGAMQTFDPPPDS
ncbi:A-kinase anchor protein 10, mitochondrial-like [Saccostrea echinata]|uniref:A-kinase anchor protein 10, mitochondrial-like n=1 Tax=Saccostrea echinata TaxID=191078 RepID=UPI002A8344D9|nr:A-kinase anchor protein 10, mitochondrial-like [Saccostrea echinata]